MWRKTLNILQFSVTKLEIISFHFLRGSISFFILQILFLS